VIEARQISRRFGNITALRDVSFTARRGEVLGLVGPNGAGKTTLLEILSGLLAADTGFVSWDGTVLPRGRRKHVMFYVPEAITPYPAETVRALLMLFAGLFNREERLLAGTTSALRLGPVLDMRVGNLSKGYRRRLLVALGLLAPQPVIVMDEPFDGLDLRQTREVIGLIREAAARGRTLLLSIHQLVDAERACERFVLLSSGTVRGHGTLDELRGAARVGQAGLEEVFLALT
jgi:ABC-2 type transport system ATP-binding protein